MKKRRIFNAIVAVMVVLELVMTDISAFAQEIGGNMFFDAQGEILGQENETPTPEPTESMDPGENAQESPTPEETVSPAVSPGAAATPETTPEETASPGAEETIAPVVSPSASLEPSTTVEPGETGSPESTNSPENTEEPSLLPSEEPTAEAATSATMVPSAAMGIKGTMGSNVFEAASGGTGTCDGFIAPIDDPDASAVKITTAEEFYAIRNDLYGSYVLENDIDLSGYEDWSPIGDSPSNAFYGKLDGQGHKITGLTITENLSSGTIKTPTYAVGLFGVCNGAQIKNVAVENADVSITTTSGYRYPNNVDDGYNVYAGIIAGYVNNSAVIYNCCSSGQVLAKAYEEGASGSAAGGMIGWADTAIISYCNNTADVQGYNGNAVQAYNAYAGGLVGRFSTEGTIDRSYNSGTVSAMTLDYGNAYAGGLLASVASGLVKITDSYNAGQVQGQAGNMFCESAYAGGIAAEYLGTIDNVYNSGSVVAYANDPYGISNSTAYAGGICGIGSSDVKITDSAIVQSSVSASSSGAKYQYRISYLSMNTNTITVDTVTSGSTNDASIIKSLDTLKTADPYMDVLGWDFEKIWEMRAGEDFPRLRVVDTESDDYKNEYITQHLEYIESSSYKDILDNYRWAQIYWSQENNFASNMGEKLYDGVDAAVSLLTLDFAALFDDGNPYKVILADYISDQTVQEEQIHLYELNVPYALDEKYKEVEQFIKDNWKDAYGELSDEDLYWLFHYGEKSSEEWINQDFEKNIHAIVYDDKVEGLDTVLGVASETLDTILDQKAHLDNTIEWFNGLIDYSGQVAAYLTADEEFKIILSRMCENLPESTSQEKQYKSQLSEAIESYTQYNDKEDVRALLFVNYLKDSAVERFTEFIKSTMNKQITNWIGRVFSEAALSKLKKIGWAADVTWKITEYVTQNGELQECREMLRANAYFEQTMYNTLKSIEDEFEGSQTIENAKLFDAAYKFFKETEIYSMDITITYMDTYQTAWLSAIRNLSNTFMNSAIEEVHINKLFLYKAYCHGTTYYLGGKVIMVACPTDVFVYDENGDIVASVEENVITKCAEGIVVSSINDVKIITVPIDQNYSVKVSATENGNMSYSVSEYDIDGRKVQTAIYPDIAINKGVEYSGKINTELATSAEEYKLISSSGEAIGNPEIVKETTNVAVTSIEVRADKEILSVGESLSLKKTILPDNASVQNVVWTTSDSKIASVSENGEVTGIAEGIVTITAHALCGGVQDSISLAVVSDETKLCFTKQPKSGEYVKGEEATSLSIEYYVKDNAEVKCQWYVSENADMSEKKAVEGAIADEYKPSTKDVGILYYCVELTSGNEKIISEIARIKVVENKPVASGSIGNSIQWQLTDNYTLCIQGSGDLESFASVEEIPWKEYKDQITELTVLDGITSVGVNIFTGMTALKSIEIGKSVTDIGEGAFAGCEALEEITIPFVGISRTATADQGVLGAIFGKVSADGVCQYYKKEGSSLKGYHYGIPETLSKVILTDEKSIPFGAFYNCSRISEIILNEGIASLGEYSFANCSQLTSICIPNSVTIIGEYTLKGCEKLESVTLPFVGASEESTNTYDSVFGYIFGRASEGTVQYYELVDGSLSGYKYDIASALTNVTITCDANIPFGAFSNCTNIQSIHFESDIKEIASYAFYNEDGLNTIYFEKDAPEIQNDSFKGCGDILAYIPQGNTTWVDTVKKNYGANSIEWRVKDQALTYVVAFQSNGGTEVENQQVEENGKAVKPEDPTREGYTFVGWYLDGSLYDFSLPITANIRLEAVWKELTALNGPTANIASGSAVPEGSRIILTSDQSDAEIYYTLDGTDPTGSSFLYEEPIVIEKETVIKAVVMKAGYRSSSVVTFTYTVSANKEDWGDVLPEDVPEGGVEAIPNDLWIAGIEEEGYTYTGKAIKPEVRVYDYKTLLREKTDYTISYKNNVKANDASAEKTAPTITVTGKGNYTGKETITFKILPRDISGEDFSADDITLNYNKKSQKPVPTVYRGTAKLRNKADYTVEYPELSENPDAYREPGTYEILIKGTGGYTGERTIQLTITQATLMSKASVSKIANQPYTGSAVTTETMQSAPVVKLGKNVLAEGTHYTVSYEDNVEIGTATLILKGTETETPEGTFVGEKKVTFKITGGALNKAKVTGIPRSLVYTGEELTLNSPSWGDKPVLTMTVNKEVKTLTEGTDYTVSYQKNTDKGTGIILFTGINGYTGTLKKTFRITAYDIGRDTEGKMSAVLEGQPVYAKGGSKPEPVVTFDGTELIPGKDYTLSYKNNTAVNDGSNAKKIPTVTIKGKGNYSGSMVLTYTIAQQDISSLSVSAADKVYKNKRDAYRSVPKVTDLDGKTLGVGKDYEKTFIYSYGERTVLADGTVREENQLIGLDDILPAGTLVEVTVTGKGNYTGILKGQYRIVAADIAGARITIPDQTYTGKEITPDESQVTATLKKETLQPGVDYEIVEGSYKDNVKKGTASVTVRGIGNYGGTKAVKFKIKAKGFLWWWRH